MKRKHTGIAFVGGFKGCQPALHINQDYTSFSNIAGKPAMHSLIFNKNKLAIFHFLVR